MNETRIVPGFEGLAMSAPALPFARRFGHRFSESVPVLLSHSVRSKLGVLGSEVAALFDDHVWVVHVGGRPRRAARRT